MALLFALIYGSWVIIRILILGDRIPDSCKSEEFMQKKNLRCAGCVDLRAGWGRDWRIGR